MLIREERPHCVRRKCFVISRSEWRAIVQVDSHVQVVSVYSFDRARSGSVFKVVCCLLEAHLFLRLSNLGALLYSDYTLKYPQYFKRKEGLIS